MPVPINNLGVHVFQADVSQQAQNTQNQSVRAGAEIAQVQAQDQGKEEVLSQVQEMKETENREIQGDARGAHSHSLKRRQEKKKEAEPKAEPEPSPPDPTGRGQHLDFSA